MDIPFDSILQERGCSVSLCMLPWLYHICVQVLFPPAKLLLFLLGFGESLVKHNFDS